MTSKILRTFGAASLVALVGALAAACGGQTVPGQHDQCKTQSDCPTGNDLTCVTTSPNQTCEVVCNPNGPSSCPTGQTCTRYYGMNICYETSA